MSISQRESEEQRLRRWRLVLGGGESDGIGVPLSDTEDAIDRAISALYDNGLGQNSPRKGGLGNSSPRIATWLGDIRKYFPSSVVQVMQKDALTRFNLRQLLLEPELLAATEPDVRLVATLLSLKDLIPAQTRSTARSVVQRVVDEIMRRISSRTRQAVAGSINRSLRNNRPRHNEINWNRTIRANLKHYLAVYKTVIPERRIGFGRRQSALRDIILCIDQSGSMAESVIYGAVFGAVLATLPSVSTKLVLFDTSVVDITDEIDDPVDVLFGVQLGGGTDINQALSYCQGLVRRPVETIFVLISDLYEGNGAPTEMLKRAALIASSGVTFITLLALNDQGAPSYDHESASALASFGIPCFAATPDQFPDLIASAIANKDLFEWAAKQNIVTARTTEQ
jgi:Mg-chelatase subunit ChlD